MIAENKIENTSKKNKYQATIHKRFSAGCVVGREGETGTPRCVVRRVGEPNSPVAGARARAGEERAEVTGGLLERVGEGAMACAAIVVRIVVDQHIHRWETRPTAVPRLGRHRLLLTMGSTNPLLAGCPHFCRHAVTPQTSTRTRGEGSLMGSMANRHDEQKNSHTPGRGGMAPAGRP